ncbi:hypothetical protein CGRA01v4_13428 [Colletotrichum graminicola]|nr:hypothetical protein CGRA01v4_13428 [Colletotrichum graminicola]
MADVFKGIYSKQNPGITPCKHHLQNRGLQPLSYPQVSDMEPARGASARPRAPAIRPSAQPSGGARAGSDRPVPCPRTVSRTMSHGRCRPARPSALLPRAGSYRLLRRRRRSSDRLSRRRARPAVPPPARDGRRGARDPRGPPVLAPDVPPLHGAEQGLPDRLDGLVLLLVVEQRAARDPAGVEDAALLALGHLLPLLARELLVPRPRQLPARHQPRALVVQRARDDPRPRPLRRGQQYRRLLHLVLAVVEHVDAVVVEGVGGRDAAEEFGQLPGEVSRRAPDLGVPPRVVTGLLRGRLVPGRLDAQSRRGPRGRRVDVRGARDQDRLEQRRLRFAPR